MFGYENNRWTTGVAVSHQCVAPPPHQSTQWNNIQVELNSLEWGQQESSRFYLDSNGKFEFYFPNLK
jgi:hypothetical protein